MNEPTKRSIIVGIFFLILFTAYASFSTIITQIHEQDGLNALGPSLLAVNYSAFMIMNVLAPGFTWKFSKLMGLAAIGYAINFSSGLLLGFLSVPLKYVVTLTGAAIAGTGSATLWTCLGGYLHIVCEKNNQIADKGKYYGIFSAIYCAQSILGALITTFGLGLFSKDTYFAIVGTIGLLSSIFCFVFVKDVQTNEDMERMTKFNGIRSAKNLFKFYPKMKHTLPLIFVDGLVIGFINTSLTHFIPKSESDHQANLKAGIAFILYGIGSIISGYLSGIFCDKFQLKISGYTNTICFIFLIGVSLYGTMLNNFGYACFVFFCWGFTLYYIETWMLVACSRFYNGKLQSFSINKQFHSLAVVIYEIISISSGNKIPLQWILSVMLVFAIPAVLGLYFMDKKYSKDGKIKLRSYTGGENSLLDNQQLITEESASEPSKSPQK